MHTSGLAHALRTPLNAGLFNHRDVFALQAVFLISYYGLPSEFKGIFNNDPEKIVKNWYMFICVAVGLWGGLIIGVVTERYTSNAYSPVQVRGLELMMVQHAMMCSKSLLCA